LLAHDDGVETETVGQWDWSIWSRSCCSCRHWQTSSTRTRS